MHARTQAEEAQKRMEVMYNIYTWSTQLSSRLAAGALLVVAEAAEGHKRTNPDDLVSRAVKQLITDCRYHGARLSPHRAVNRAVAVRAPRLQSRMHPGTCNPMYLPGACNPMYLPGELFNEPSSALVLRRIEALGLPNSLDELGEQLLAQCAQLLQLALRSLGAMAAAAEQHKIKAMRSAAAQRAMLSIETVEKTFPALQARGIAVPPEATETLAQLVGRLTPLLPAADIDSDDDEYY